MPTSDEYREWALWARYRQITESMRQSMGGGFVAAADMAERVEKVKALHQIGDDFVEGCPECKTGDWPCPTLALLVQGAHQGGDDE